MNIRRYSYSSPLRHSSGCHRPIIILLSFPLQVVVHNGVEKLKNCDGPAIRPRNFGIPSTWQHATGKVAAKGSLLCRLRCSTIAHLLTQTVTAKPPVIRYASNSPTCGPTKAMHFWVTPSSSGPHVRGEPIMSAFRAAGSTQNVSGAAPVATEEARSQEEIDTEKYPRRK